MIKTVEKMQQLMNGSNPYLGILDWGIGGLGFYRAFKKRYPQHSVFYFSDAGYTPYGKLCRSELKQRLGQLFDLFSKLGLTHLVVACNAASTALPFENSKLKITGILQPGLQVLQQASREPIAMIGGQRTVRSNWFLKNGLDHGIKIRQRIAQPLSAFIEKGQIDSSHFDAQLWKILKPIRNYKTLLLACTHYSAVSEKIQQMLPETKVLDPIPCLVDWLQQNWEISASPGKDIFFSTAGSEAMKLSAKVAFRVELDRVGSVIF